MFGDDILIYETTDFKQVDKWELSRPIEDGFGRINFNSLDDSNEEPGYMTGLFTVQDAVQNRRIMGVARVNLQKKSVDWYPLGPATGIGFAMAAGRQWAYGLHSEIGKYEFWSFDLANHKMGPHVEFPGRPAYGAEGQHEWQSVICAPGREHDRLVRFVELQVHAYDHARRRYDYESVCGAGQVRAFRAS